MILPMVTVSAELDPLVPAKKKQPKIVAIPMPPFSQPTRASPKPTKSRAMRPLDMISPARMNNGSASNAQLSSEANSVVLRLLSEYAPVRIISDSEPIASTINNGNPITRWTNIKTITIDATCMVLRSNMLMPPRSCWVVGKNGAVRAA